jgi:hypothetical protein
MQNRYEFAPTGELIRWTPAVVVGGEQVLKAYARNRPCVANDALLPGYKVKVRPSGGYTLGKRFSHCKLNTHFAPVVDEQGDSWLAPTYSPTSTSVETSCDIEMSNIPEVDMWFFLDGRNCYIVWHDKLGGRLLLPPFNNIYDDGRVCMGGAFTIIEGSATERFDHAWDWFNSATANTDLNRGGSPLRFDPETKALRDYTDDEPRERLLNSLRTVSNDVFEGFFASREVTI